MYIMFVGLYYTVNTEIIWTQLTFAIQSRSHLFPQLLDHSPVVVVGMFGIPDRFSGIDLYNELFHVHLAARKKQTGLFLEPRSAPLFAALLYTALCVF